ncbi:ATP-binding cassette domain-containing protein [Candidatus Venteria ishoeyi]|uniref:ATP-binding cassette domain-containing protein n=1 Tax=Candidatus Venteria ishoeyi TaxID=1899563 RepID=UPI0025A614E1|nr:ATP-binding cassette domain-containing protein [Candidatus Venteria ishoeyi]MDM8546941.1 ATP-binding cassette domain-containing protein [Candidatus Venteria ishoeyi]
MTENKPVQSNKILVEARGLVPHAETSDMILPPLDCQIPAGSITCLIGPFGIAKEAYLRALACIEVPAAGELRLLGNACTYLSPEQWRELRQHAVYILRDAPLLSSYNAFLNVMLPALYHHLADHAQVEEKARRLIQETGIQCDVSVLPAYLDEYQRRCLAITRGLMLDPDVLFIDDTFRQLEHEECQLMGNYLTHLVRDHGLAVVTSTFDLTLARKQADLIIFLTRKHIRCYDSWQAMLDSDDEEVHNFLSNAMN